MNSSGGGKRGVFSLPSLLGEILDSVTVPFQAKSALGTETTSPEEHPAVLSGEAVRSPATDGELRGREAGSTTPEELSWLSVSRGSRLEISANEFNTRSEECDEFSLLSGVLVEYASTSSGIPRSLRDALVLVVLTEGAGSISLD